MLEPITVVAARPRDYETFGRQLFFGFNYKL
jgi:hypothetical protein